MKLFFFNDNKTEIKSTTETHTFSQKFALINIFLNGFEISILCSFD